MTGKTSKRITKKGGRNMKQKYRYELRQVEAWADPECGWTWNCSWHMTNLSTSADDLRGVLRRALKKQGITVLRPK